MTEGGTTGYIGAGLVVRGRLTGHGDMQIDGRLEGDVRIEGGLDVGPDGHVVASVEGSRVSVEGYVRGDVVGSQSVSIHEGGRVDGDVRSTRIAIDDGGFLHGGIQMDFELPDDLGFEAEET
jgi:cytoskeletal protein CcmA (bactofilin family)